LTGKPVPNLDGISLLPTLMGQAAAQKNHPFFYFEYPENGGQLAVRIGNWKGIKRNVRKEPSGAWELYNMETDRYEKNNVAAAHPDIIREMMDIAKREHVHPHIMDWEFIDPKIKKAQ